MVAFSAVFVLKVKQTIFLITQTIICFITSLIIKIQNNTQQISLLFILSEICIIYWSNTGQILGFKAFIHKDHSTYVETIKIIMSQEILVLLESSDEQALASS
jgi:NADH:ubiquinone oxidoreductase subunit 2 (subunit N)